MAKTGMKIAVSAVVLFLTFGLACASFAAPGLSALIASRDGSQPNCVKISGKLAKMECAQHRWTCPLASTPGLSPLPRLFPHDFLKSSQLVIAKGYPSSVLEEIYLKSAWRISPYQIVFPQGISIYLLNSVLTL